MTHDEELRRANEVLSHVPRFGSASHSESLALMAMLIALRDTDHALAATARLGDPRPAGWAERHEVYVLSRDAAEDALRRGDVLRSVGRAIELAIALGEALLATYAAARVA